MRSSLVLALALASSSCVVGAPPGFGDGDVWTLPLVAPLEDDVLLVPVSVNDKGPYLFLIDPDSNTSTLDSALVSELDLYSAYGPEELTEADNKIPTFYAEVPKMEAGNLVVRNHKWRVHKVGTYWVGGRRVRGVLGKDIIADSLIFAVDRDAGIAQLGEQGKLSPPPGASKVGFRHFFGRKLAKVTINGDKKMTMHLDLGGRVSRLWPEKLKSAKLPRINVDAKLVDEYGTVQRVNTGAIAAKVEAGGETVQGLLIVAFGDKRLDKHDIDGSLGQDFFSRFQIVANWHKKSMWLSKRDPDLHARAAERIKRWDALFAGCKTPGCVSVSIGDGGMAPGGFSRVETRTRNPDPFLMADPAEQPAEPEPAPDDSKAKPNPDADMDKPVAPVPPPPPPPQAPRFRVEREANAPELVAKQRLEVLLDAVNAEGQPLGLPKIQVTLRSGNNVVEGQLDSSYAGAAKLVILDISPLGRTCEAGEKCFWIQTKKF